MNSEYNLHLEVDIRKKLKDFSLDISFEAGRGCLGILGPSGCGKSMTLKSIAGIIRPDQGRIALRYAQGEAAGGRVLYDSALKINEKPQVRRVGYLFQNYALFPGMTVEQNIMVGLKGGRGNVGLRRRRPMSGEARQQKVSEMVERFRLQGLEKRFPGQLSGGQQQRVALARAIVIHPQVLLMDEPLSNLDAKLRIEMRSAIRDVQKQVGITTVYVTHDQEEALAISDRIAVMKLGIIQQIGSPQDIYARPYNAFVSTFIGHSNLFFGTIRKQGSVPSVVFEGGYHVEMANLVDTVTEGQKVVVSVRPEEFSLNPEGMECEIISRTFLGKYTNYFLRFGDGMVLEDQPSIEYSQDLGHVDRIFSVGEKIRLRPNPNKINVFTQDMEQSLIKDVKRYDE